MDKLYSSEFCKLGETVVCPPVNCPIYAVELQRGPTCFLEDLLDDVFIM